MTPVFSDDESDHSAKNSTPIHNGELYCVRSQIRLARMLLNICQPWLPQFSVDQDKHAEPLA